MTHAWPNRSCQRHVRTSVMTAAVMDVIKYHHARQQDE